MTSSGNNIYELSINLPYKNEALASLDADKKDLSPKFTSLITSIFDTKMDFLSKKIKILFSFDGIFMSVVNLFNQSYVIYNLELNENLKFSPNAVKIGKGIDVVWCAYDNYFAVVSNSENLGVKGKKVAKCYFSLSVYCICTMNYGRKEFNVKSVYTLNE